MLQMFSTNVLNKIFPKVSKEARISPLFKKGDISSPENYRPISSLRSLNKVFEKLKSKRTKKYFRKNESFIANQNGFKIKRSCTHALGEILDYIRNEIDKRYAGNAFLMKKKCVRVRASIYVS